MAADESTDVPYLNAAEYVAKVKEILSERRPASSCLERFIIRCEIEQELVGNSINEDRWDEELQQLAGKFRETGLTQDWPRGRCAMLLEYLKPSIAGVPSRFLLREAITEVSHRNDATIIISTLQSTWGQLQRYLDFLSGWKWETCHRKIAKEDLDRSAFSVELTKMIQRLRDFVPTEIPAVNTDLSKDESNGTTGAGKKKKSTNNGDARAKLIAGLTKHHEYSNGSCGNFNPIGNNELSRMVDVDRSTASAFFTKQFGCYQNYQIACSNKQIVESLKLLNGEVTPRLLLTMEPEATGVQDDE